MNMRNSSGSAFASQNASLTRRIRQRKQPVQGRSQATVEAILDATLQVLMKQGVARFNTASVSERAGVSVGTLYQYFPDKESLVTAVAVRSLTQMRAAVEVAAREVAEVPRRQGLSWLIERLVTFKRDNLASIRALRETMASRESIALVRDVMDRTAALFAPFTAGPMETQVLMSAIEGAINYAIDYQPDFLSDPRFVTSLKRLARTLAK